ncbi:MAG: L-asparaginase, partial [Acidobacteria bacterium]|nr:L-asparaginase [Acidobacteriota bacterium]
MAFYRGPTCRHTINSEFDIDSIKTLPKVEVISAYYDADPALIQAAVDAGVKGIVVSGCTSAGIPFRSQVPL